MDSATDRGEEIEDGGCKNEVEGTKVDRLMVDGGWLMAC